MARSSSPHSRPGARDESIDDDGPVQTFGRQRPVFPEDVYEILPFNRSIIGTLIIGVFLVVFCIPYFDSADMRGPGGDSLFGLVSALFSFFWFLGWSVGVAFLVIMFFGTIFGRETLHVQQGLVILRKDMFGLGLETEYDWDGISGLRQETGADEPKKQWRRRHIAFEYDGNTVRVGCSLDEARAEQIMRDMRAVGASGFGMLRRDRVPLRHETNATSEPVSAAVEAGSDSSLAAIALVVANLIPLLGVALGDWRLLDVMLLFWAESGVIGFYNLLKIWVVGRWAILFLGPFFIGHFGGFMVGHLLFIYALFVDKHGGPRIATAEVLADFLHLWPALAALFVSHGLSFVQNFIGRREFEGRRPNDLMGEPYVRIALMHVTLIVGGFVAMFVGEPILAVVLLVVLKAAVDLGTHRKRHGRPRLHGTVAGS